MLSLFESLNRHASRSGAAPAVSDDTQHLTYRDLLDRVAGLVGALEQQPKRVGLLAPNSADWIVAQIACVVSGRTVVPLPSFFSAQQLGHIAADAAIETVLAARDHLGRAAGFGLRTFDLGAAPLGGPMPDHVSGFEQIIYTSGTTGNPKGVLHGSRQIAWMTEALAKVTAAASTDRHLSVLPLPLLLEQISALFVPISVGAHVHLDTAAAELVGRAETPLLARSADDFKPTTTVLVPQLLKAWTAQLGQSGHEAPDSLRFVAVGGAHVADAALDEARQCGIPAYAGYGLSECCSVVAVQTEDGKARGTVGRPLSGLTVTIEDGEIVVEGPSVMEGYLGSGSAPARWHTGDTGSFDPDGNLIVHGRVDSIITSSFGRNISPEWIEALIAADIRIAACAIADSGLEHILAVIVPSALGRDLDERDFVSIIATRCAEAPSYAVPRSCLVIAAAEAKDSQLFTASGRPRRKAIRALVDHECSVSQFCNAKENSQ